MKLNEVSKMIGTDDKNLAVSVAIKTLVKSGVPAEDAIAAVLGGDIFDKIANEFHAIVNAG